MLFYPPIYCFFPFQRPSGVANVEKPEEEGGTGTHSADLVGRVEKGRPGIEEKKGCPIKQGGPKVTPHPIFRG